ncbi:fatty acid/sphingolipid desaturase [Gonapodya prolifera JEL478]|uniref:Fatty acid/sphingolipid desaturase n=1 Tax=Gonapodya prolifera (strain JEL478) TaxID=1344416 RepID=A0A139A181_GONPJ|nr:fatty acid/sphingolipid desaturase [Gonapodya prolifera JEL478]|eukprot:KXS10113.1 fatty acid/sphingolipid desaturase [Gonapodya prolifera JEL478]
MATRTIYLSEFLKRNAAGDCLVVFEGGVYNLTAFQKIHPGGPLVIDHLKGKNATDAIYAYHPSDVIAKRLPNFFLGRLADDGVDSGIESDETSEDGALEEPPANRLVVPMTRVEKAGGAVGYGALVSDTEISRDFRKLHQKLEELGFFETDKSFYIREVLKFAACIAIIIYTGIFAPRHILSYIACAFTTAFLWQQSAFVGHDIGHTSVLRSSKWDYILGTTVGNALLGFSIGWWKSSHNVHHIVTNSPEHDSDIQHLPFFAVSTRLMSKVYSSYYNVTWDFPNDKFAQLMISVQHYSYWPILCFGRFFLYLQSVKHLVTSDWCPYRYWEACTMLVFLSWQAFLISHFHSWTGIALYVFMSHALTMILHLQITVSHYSMSTADAPENEDWATKALRTSLDVECPKWLDWFHGGLQFQVEHHLFPRIARQRLREVRPYVADFAARHGLELHTQSFVEGNMRTFRNFKAVAEFAEQAGFAWGRIGGKKINVATKLE